jgi:hypothetical protein
MFPTEIAGACVAACRRMKAWGASILGVSNRRRRGEHERYFGSSADRFELERRERAYTRWDSHEGSLLGR